MAQIDGLPIFAFQTKSMWETINPVEDQGLEKMKAAIKPYITPHSLDHDSHWEDDFFTGLPGFHHKRNEDKGTYTFLREENIELYRRIERQAGEWLQSSMMKLWPLLKDHHFRSVYLMVDLFGLIFEGSSVAGYNPEWSRPAKGVYSFVLSRPLALRMMKHREEDKEMDTHEEHTLVHEVIHMLDHWDLLKPSLLAISDDPWPNLRYCMLKFRGEGSPNSTTCCTATTAPSIPSRRQGGKQLDI